MTHRTPPPAHLWAVLTTPIAPWAEIIPDLVLHRDYQAQLLADGILVGSGPFVEPDGQPAGFGLSLLDVATREEAEEIATGDPLVRSGLRKVEVHQWRLNQVQDRGLAR